MKWQDFVKYTSAGTASILLVLTLIVSLSGMTESHSGDISCGEVCESYVNITSTYWRVCFDNAGSKDLFFKKQVTSRTLYVNLDKMTSFVITQPEVRTELLVPAVGKDKWRPIKSGDCIERKSIKPVNRFKIVGHKPAEQTVKWGFILDNYLMEGINIDPIWYGSGNDSQLFAHYKCEGDFLDSSGKANHGTQSGGVSIGAGAKGRGCVFGGVDEYFSKTGFDNVIDNVTVSAWVKLAKNPTTSTYGDIFRHFAKYILDITSGGSVRFYVYDLSDPDVITTSTVPVGNWTFVVGQFNGSHLNVFINGVLDTSVASTGTIPSVTTTTAYVGQSGSSTYYFNGTIDEVRVYNRTLSVTEIYSLYNTSKTAYLNIYTTPTKGLLDETGLWAHYDFDNNNYNSTHIFDMSGSGNHISYSGSNPTKTNLGVFKDGIDFRVLSDDSFFLDNVGINVSVYSVSMWFREPAETASQSHMFAMQLVGGYNYEAIRLGFYNNSPTGFNRIAMSNDYALSDVVISLTDGDIAWHHLVVTYNDTDCMYAYYDGALISSDCGLTPFDRLLDNFWIGTYAGSTYNANCLFDDFKFYLGRILNATEVAQLYNGSKTNYVNIYTTPVLGTLNDTHAPTLTSETGLIGWWKMNGDALDSSGFGNNGTVTGAVSTSNGRWEEGYYFDGSGDYINLGNDSALNFSSNFSISVWAKPDKVGGFANTILARLTNPADGGYNPYFLRFDTTNKVFFYASSDGANWGTTIISSSSAVADTWYHIVVTYDDVLNDTILYINSVAEGIDPASVIPYGGEKNTYIGTRYGVSFNGTIDELRFYNKTLSASEVKELYLSKGLVGHWKMDAGVSNSTSTLDSSGYVNTGTLSGATLTNEGKFKEAYKFDGIDDYVSVSNSAAVNFSTNDFSISLWEKIDTASEDGGYLLTKGAGYYGHGGTNPAYSIYGVTASDYLVFQVSNTTLSTQHNAWCYFMMDNRWHHIVGVKNSTGVFIYCDGVKSTQSGSAIGGDISANYNLLLGVDYDGVGHNINGTIDEVRIYNRALSATEIGYLYNGTRTNYINLWSLPG